MKRISISNPVRYQGVLQKVGDVVEVEDWFALSALSGGYAALATEQQAPPPTPMPSADVLAATVAAVAALTSTINTGRLSDDAVASRARTVASAIRASAYALADGAVDVNVASMTAGSKTLTLRAWNPILTAAHVGKIIAVEGAGASLTVALGAGYANGAQIETLTVAALPSAVPAGNLTITEGANSIVIYHAAASAGATSINVVRTALTAAFTTAATVTLARPLVTTVDSVNPNGWVATLHDAAVTTVADLGYVVGTDNTAALQAAIDAAAQANLPLHIDGCYVTRELTLHPQSALIGTSPAGLFPVTISRLSSVLALAPGANSSVLTAAVGDQFVTIRGVAAYGTSWAQTVAKDAIAAPAATAPRELSWNLDDVFVGWASGNGISIGNNTRGSILRKVMVYRCAGNGLRVDGTDNVIDNSFFGANILDGVRGSGPANILTKGNIWGNRHGIYNDARSWQIQQNYIDANRGHGVFGPGMTKAQVTDNKFTPQAAAGTGGGNMIHLQGNASEVLIADNWIGKPPGPWGYAPSYGIYVEAGSSYVDGGNYIDRAALNTATKGGGGAVYSTLAPLEDAQTAAMVSGRWYAPPTPSIITGTPTEAQERAAKIIVARDCSIDQIAASVVTAGSAGALVRLGIRAHDPATDMPGAVLADAGTVAADVTGVRSITLGTALAVKAGTILWLSMAVQGAAATRPVLRQSGGSAFPFGDASAAATLDNVLAGVQANASQTGALSAAPGWSHTTGPYRVAVHVA